MEKAEILEMIQTLSIPDRLEILEEVLRKIRKAKSLGTEPSGTGILEFAGIIEEKEATVMLEAISESRKIDYNGW